jgi:hypothetical protein
VRLVTEPELSFDRRLQRTRELAPNFVGLDEDQADELARREGLTLRSVHLPVPGTSGRYSLTADLRPDRVTLFFQGALVERSQAG